MCGPKQLILTPVWFSDTLWKPTAVYFNCFGGFLLLWNYVILLTIANFKKCQYIYMCGCSAVQKYGVTSHLLIFCFQGRDFLVVFSKSSPGCLKGFSLDIFFSFSFIFSPVRVTEHVHRNIFSFVFLRDSMLISSINNEPNWKH